MTKTNVLAFSLLGICGVATVTLVQKAKRKVTEKAKQLISDKLEQFVLQKMEDSLETMLAEPSFQNNLQMALNHTVEKFQEQESKRFKDAVETAVLDAKNEMMAMFGSDKAFWKNIDVDCERFHEEMMALREYNSFVREARENKNCKRYNFFVFRNQEKKHRIYEVMEYKDGIFIRYGTIGSRMFSRSSKRTYSEICASRKRAGYQSMVENPNFFERNV